MRSRARLFVQVLTWWCDRPDGEVAIGTKRVVVGGLGDQIGVTDPIEISRRLRRRIDRAGVSADVAGDVNVVVSTGRGRATSRQSAPIRQGRSTRTAASAVRPPEGVTVTDTPGLSEAELDAQDGEELPDREQMSLVNANIAIPVNAAVAANVLSDGSIAYADATQATPIDQAN